MMEHLGLGITLNLEDNFTPNADRAVQSFDRLEQGAQHLHRSMGESMSSLQNLMLSGFSMGQVGDKFEKFGDSIVGGFKKTYADMATVGSKFENFKIRFDTFFKDMADKKMDWGLKFAEKTPFRLEETLDAMTSFKVMGMDVDKQFQTTIKDGKELHTVTKDMMTALGDIGALKPEQGIAGAMYAIREWYGGSKRSFKNRFEIDPEQALGRKISTSNPDQFMKDWIEFSEKKAPGLLNKLSDSWMTITDNIEDAIEIIKYKISKQDVFKSVKETAKSLYIFLNTIDVDKLGKAFGTALSVVWKPVDLLAKGIMKLTVAFTNFASAHPILTRLVIGLTALSGITIGLVGRILKLSGGFLILTTSLVSAYTNLKLLNTFSDLATVFSGLGRGLHRLIYTLKLTGFLIGAFAIAWHTNFMGMRDIATTTAQRFSTAWGNATSILDQGLNTTTLNMIGWKGVASQMGVPIDDLTKKLMKLKLIGLVIGRTLFGKEINGELQYTTKEVNNLEAMGLLPLAQTFALLRGRAEAFCNGLLKGLGTIWGMISNYTKFIFKPVQIFLNAIGLNLNRIKDTLSSIFNIKGQKGIALSDGERHIQNAKNLGKALGGVLGVLLGFKAVRLITPVILAPFKALNKSISNSVLKLNSLKSLMSKTGATQAVSNFAQKHPFTPIGKFKRIKDRTKSYLNEYNAVPVLSKKNKEGYQRVNGGVFPAFRDYGLKTNPNVKNIDDLYAKERVRGLGKLLGYNYYQKGADGRMNQVGSYGGRLMMRRDNGQNKLFAQEASKNNYRALGSYQVKGRMENVLDSKGNPVLNANGQPKRRYVPTVTTNDVYANRRRTPLLDRSVGTMSSLFKGAGFGKLSSDGQVQLQALRAQYESQLKGAVKANRGAIERRLGKKLNMRSFNVPPGMDGKLEDNIKTYKKLLSRSGVDYSGIKRSYANEKGNVIRSNTRIGGGSQVYEANRGKVRQALFGKSYYTVERDSEGNLRRRQLGNQGGILRRSSRDLFRNGNGVHENITQPRPTSTKPSMFRRAYNGVSNSVFGQLTGAFTGTVKDGLKNIPTTIGDGMSRLSNMAVNTRVGQRVGGIGSRAIGAINMQRDRLGLAPLRRPSLPQGRNLATRVAKGGWGATKGIGKAIFGRSRLEAIKDAQGNIVGKRRVGGGLISRGLRGGGKVLGGAGRLIGGAGSLALGLAPYIALGTMAFKGMSARGNRIGGDSKRMSELFGKDYKKQKHSPIEIMLKDAEARMKKVNPNKLYNKFKVGAKKTFPIIKNIAITTLRQIRKVMPSILNDAWKGLKAGAKLAWIWIKTSGIQYMKQFVMWVLTTGVPKLINGLRRMTLWLLETGVPMMMSGMGKFVGWVAANVVPKLISYIGKFITWVISVGIPKLIEGIAKIGVWVVSHLPSLGAKVLKFAAELGKGVFRAIVDGLKGIGSAMWNSIGNGLKSMGGVGSKIAAVMGIHHEGLWMSPDEHPAIIKKDETVLPPALSHKFNEMFISPPPKREQRATNTPSKVDNSIHIDNVTIEVKADKLSRADAREQAKLILREFKSMQKEENIRAFA